MQPAYDLTPQALLVALGVEVYGPEWRRPLARALGLSGAQVARLAHGAPVTPATRAALAVWARELLAAEPARVARRIELLTAATIPNHQE